MKIIILAGGRGKRLWPLSRDSFPKQFLNIGSRTSLLQKTILRFLKIELAKEIFILTHSEYHHIVVHQVETIDPDLKNQILMEPCCRDTGPAILFAVKYLQEMKKITSKEVILVAPSDHLMEPDQGFTSLIPFLQPLLEREKGLITFGIAPDRIETGFGYLQVNPAIDQPPPYKVLQFIEKPPAEIAKELIEKGNSFWNSGMLASNAENLFFQMKQHHEELGAATSCSYEELQKKYETLTSISIDLAILEKSSDLLLFPLSLRWSDIGSWDSFFTAMEKDRNHNVKIGNIHDIDTKNSLIYSEKGLISTIGLEDTILIQTDDVLFIGKMGESQKVKALVEELKNRSVPQISISPTTFRPWGEYSILEEGTRFKVKRIIVHPGQRLSLQFHYHRSEHWVVVRGTARVKMGLEEKILHENESLYVPKSTLHRLENPGKVPLELIEIQVGEYTEEDDIVRVEEKLPLPSS